MKRVLLLVAMCPLLALGQQREYSDAELQAISFQGQLTACQAESALKIRKLEKEISELKAASEK